MKDAVAEGTSGPKYTKSEKFADSSRNIEASLTEACIHFLGERWSTLVCQ